MCHASASGDAHHRKVCWIVDRVTFPPQILILGLLRARGSNHHTPRRDRHTISGEIQIATSLTGDRSLLSKLVFFCLISKSLVINASENYSFLHIEPLESFISIFDPSHRLFHGSLASILDYSLLINATVCYLIHVFIDDLVSCFNFHFGMSMPDYCHFQSCPSAYFIPSFPHFLGFSCRRISICIAVPPIRISHFGHFSIKSPDLSVTWIKRAKRHCTSKNAEGCFQNHLERIGADFHFPSWGTVR